MQTLLNKNTYYCGNHPMIMDENLLSLESTSAYQDKPDFLTKSLKENGYLYLPKFFDHAEITEALNEIKEALQYQGYLNQRTLIEPHRSKLFSPEEFTSLKKYYQLMENIKLISFFKALFQEEVYTYPYKWLRAVKTQDHTGIHFDHVYMGRGSERLLTCWVALEDIPLEKGGLLMSSQIKNIDDLKSTYGQADIDRLNLNTGWYCSDPSELSDKYQGKWLSQNYSAGDIVIFGMHQLHGSLNNNSDEYRISCDIRFQPLHEEKDPRWVNLKKFGHTSNHSNTMENQKKIWNTKI